MPRKAARSGGGLKEISGGLPKEELVKRLKALAAHLSDRDQETDHASIDEFAAALVEPHILNHRDGTVRLLAACSLADVLRIYAPNAPYSTSQLTKVFGLFVKQLQGIAKIHEPSFARCFYLLEILAVVKSFIICMELEAGDIIHELFQLFFNIVSNEHSHKVRSYMLDMMESIIEESDVVADELFDVIFENLVPKVKTERPAAYQLARSLVERTANSLQGCVHPFFIHLLGEAGEDSPLAPHVYDLIAEVDTIDHNILLRVMPHLEFQLREENVERRLAVTTMLAKMFSHKDSDLIQQDKSLWSQFLDRFRDAKPEVRQECAKYCKYFLVYHPTVAAEVAERLSSIVLDLDDRVRAEAVASVLDAAAENLASIPAKLLDTVSDRRIDKKPAIRLLTVERLARLFQSAARQANAEGEWSDAARTRVSQIPSLVLRCYFVNDPELRTCVERVTSQYLLPAKMPAAQAGERMITIFSNLDEHALAAMAKLLSRKRSVAEAFASLSAATKEGQDAVMTAVVRLCGFASEKDRPKVKEQLMKLAKNASKATFKALSACCAPDQDPETVAKARAQFAEAGRAGGKSSSFDCVLALVDLATPLAVTSERLIEYLPRLRELAESGEEDACEANTTVLLALARHARPVFEDKQVVKLLAANLGTASAALETGTLKVLPLLSDAVCALAPAVARSVKKQLSALAISGTPTQAKLATIYLTGLPDASRDDTVQNVYDTLVDSLDMNSPTLLTSLKALGYIALHAPDVFEVRQRDVISQFIVKKLLLHEPTPAEEKAQRSAAMKAARENEEEWSEEPSELCLAKVMGIKCIVRRLLGMKDVDPDALTQTSAASARLLFSLLDNVGQLKAEAYTPPPDRARLRLAAACGLLKLAGLKPLRAHISPPKFLSIGFVIQDSCNTVRCLFGAKLNKYLAQFILPLSYMSIFCLAAIDPVATNARTAAKYLQDNTQRRRKLTENSSETGAKRYNLNLLPEYALPHVISLLSYHPDFGTDPETLSEFQQYLQFFFQNIISKEHVNFDFLKGLLETMKTVKPAHDVGEGGHPKAMYILCDLALLILLKRSQKTGWKLSTFPGDIVLPQNLFARPSRPLNPKQRYLPASFEVDAGIGAAHGATSPKKAKASEKRRTPKKDGKAPSRRPKKAAKSKPEKVFAEPTRRNASRAAKANTKSLADLSDSAGSEEEEEEEPFSGSESASEENAPAARWQVTVPRAGTSVLEETQGNRRVDAPSPVKPMKANVEKAKGRKRAGSKRKSDPEEHPGSDAEQDSVTSSPTKLRRSGRRTIRT